MDSTRINLRGKILTVDQYKGQGVAVVTSGGDSQGMNPTLRAIVRTGIYCGCKIYYVKEGYTGLITGGGNIVEANWNSVSSIIHKGGTIIGTARCKEFTTFEGRVKATKNLIANEITNLIVIGGDGSLTGADKLKNQWPESLKKLLETGEITKEQAEKCAHLRVVGLLGTIDNDFPQTDMTIGVDSALHRIEEAVYSIVSTAFSHKRTFIMEVMGRHCGFLALRTALTTEADFLFMPEYPPPDNWPEMLEEKVRLGNQMGKRFHIIIVSEGATDRHNEPITSKQIQEILAQKLKLDARITVLGHVQRGGNASAYDRVLGSRSGAEALATIMEQKPTDEPVIIAIQLNQLKRIPLSECIQQLQEIKDCLAKGDYEKVIHLRGRGFEDSIEIYKILNKLEPFKEKQQPEMKRTFAILLVGTPAGGMNACIYALVRMILYSGGKVLGITGSIEGLMLGNFVELHWPDVYGLMLEGGAYLGTKRMIPPEDLYCLAAQNLNKFNVEALIIIGGFEAFVTAYNFVQRRSQHSEFCIPMVVIPATASNNVPGTDFSIGADTSINAIVKTCDLFRQSAMGTTGRVFITETMGGRCGYLCSIGALASGADSSYIFEEPFKIKDLTDDVDAMMTKMTHGGVSRGLILRNECCNDNYTTDFLTRLYSEEGKGLFTTRKNILGHIQQGYLPSSFDRSLAVKMAVKSSTYIFNLLEKSGKEKVNMTAPESAVVIGITNKGYQFNTLESLIPDVDFYNRFIKTKWWLGLRPLAKMLSEHYLVYRQEGDHTTSIGARGTYDDM